MMNKPKIALIYDRVNTPFGGAENVLVSLHEIFADAPLYASVYDAQRAAWAKSFRVIPSFLQHIPFAKKFHRLFAVLMPLAFESFDLSVFDIIISITSAEAKGVLTTPNQLHVCYVLTPTRYLWSHAEEYEKHWLTGPIRKLIFSYLRWWDEAAAFRPDVYIPISHVVAERCQRYYHRSTEEVIYPPLSFPENMTPKTTADIQQEKPFYLIVARLVPYKKIDLAIQACQKMEKNLVIIGDGPDKSRLQKIANSTRSKVRITFLSAVQFEKVIAYYSSCEAFLAPAEEDFGITVLEAQALGKPILVYEKSGGAEVIEKNKTGIYIREQSIEGIIAAIQESEQITWDSTYIQQSVQKYRQQQFQKTFQEKITKLYERMKHDEED